MTGWAPFSSPSWKVSSTAWQGKVTRLAICADGALLGCPLPVVLWGTPGLLGGVSTTRETWPRPLATQVLPGTPGPRRRVLPVVTAATLVGGDNKQQQGISHHRVSVADAR